VPSTAPAASAVSSPSYVGYVVSRQPQRRLAWLLVLPLMALALWLPLRGRGAPPSLVAVSPESVAVSTAHAPSLIAIPHAAPEPDPAAAAPVAAPAPKPAPPAHKRHHKARHE
jgi:hypothetical protein